MDASKADIQRQICGWLNIKKMVYSVTERASMWDSQGRTRSSRASHPGWPDIAIVLPGGRAFFVKVLTRTGELSADQVACRERLEAVGATIVIARSLLEVSEALKACSG